MFKFGEHHKGEIIMKDIKRVIFLIIIIICIIILAIILLNRKQVDNKINNSTPIKEEARTPEKTYEIVEVKNKISYYATRNIIGKYAYSIVNKNIEEIYAMLGEECIDNDNINKENVLEHVENIMENGELDDNFSIKTNINKMYQKQEEKTNIISFLVYGNFDYNNKIENFSIIVQMDTERNTFAILPTKYVSAKYKDLNEFSKNETNKQEIKEKISNKFSFAPVQDETIIIDYLSKYKDAIVNNIEKAYELLDKQYREERFGSLEKYKEYVEKNKREILSYNVVKYKKEDNDNITQYICMDKNDMYYIFEESAIMNFSMKLDTYTIDSNEFKETYDSANEQNKISMNINKWVSMINNRDYQTAYNVLDETFRNDNFGSVEKFENYMKEMYPKYYNIIIKDVKKESNAYVAEVEIQEKDCSIVTGEGIYTNNIIMQLKDNREFVMSFYVRRH